MTIKKLEYCLSNFDLGSRLVFEAIQRDYPQILQQRWACLGNCAECMRRPFVMVDEKEFVAASSGEELLLEIRKKLETAAPE